jgi:hypothetical protein
VNAQGDKKLSKTNYSWIKINFNPLLEFGGPWEGLGTKTPLPSMHSLAQTMKNKPHLRRKKIKIQVAQI